MLSFNVEVLKREKLDKTTHFFPTKHKLKKKKKKKNPQTINLTKKHIIHSHKETKC